MLKALEPTVHIPVYSIKAKYLFQNDPMEYLQLSFKNLSLLIDARTHRSDQGHLGPIKNEIWKKNLKFGQNFEEKKSWVEV